MNLNVSKTVILGVGGNGQAALGPADFPGTQSWHVTGVIIQTNRPGLAPVPRVQVYLDTTDVSSSQGLSYDGSFNQGVTDLKMNQGQRLIAVWSAGQVGDSASITVTGERI